jgi:hypothetical protein
MTSKQKDLLAKLALANLIVYVVFAFFWFQPSLPSLPNPFVRPTAIALKPTSAPRTPTILPISTRAPSPTSTRTVRPVVRQVTPVIPQIALATNPSTSSPNLMTPTDAWQTINPGASAWHKIGSGGFHISVFLDAKPLDGINMDIFAPGQLEQPIGRGTLQSATGQLVWAGGHWQSEGDWLARVTNRTLTAVQYKLSSSTKDISNKSCYSYWEYIGNQPYYWTECR